MTLRVVLGGPTGLSNRVGWETRVAATAFVRQSTPIRLSAPQTCLLLESSAMSWIDPNGTTNGVSLACLSPATDNRSPRRLDEAEALGRGACTDPCRRGKSS